MRKYRALEESTTSPNPNEECVISIEQVGRFRMGSITYAGTGGTLGPVTMIGYDKDSGNLIIRKPKNTSSVRFKVIEFLDT